MITTTRIILILLVATTSTFLLEAGTVGTITEDLIDGTDGIVGIAGMHHYMDTAATHGLVMVQDGAETVDTAVDTVALMQPMVVLQEFLEEETDQLSITTLALPDQM